MSIMTLAEEIEEAANNTEIEAIVIGPFGWNYNDEPDSEDTYNFGNKTPIPQELKNKPVTWLSVRDYLDYKYDTGYGAPDCHAIYAYTKDRIIFVSTYDGSTSVEWIPRNPVECKPEMFGGS